MSELWVSIIAGLVLALLSGLIGYVLNTYRQRSRLFTLVADVDGGIRRSQAEVELPERAVRLLSRSNILSAPGTHVRLESLEQLFADVETLTDYGRDFVQTLEVCIEALEAAESENSVVASLKSTLESAFFDEYVLRLLSFKPVFRAPDSSAVPFVHVIRSDVDGGRWELNIPGQPFTYIGSNLDSLISADQRLEPLIRQIEVADRGLLIESMETIRASLLAEIDLADSLREIISPLLEEWSHWIVSMYVANYGPTATYIMPQSLLLMSDKPLNISNIATACVLALPTEDGGYAQTDSGVMIPAGEVREIGWITAQPQRGMNNTGSVLRTSFKGESGEARMDLDIIGTGFRRNQTISTERFAFGQEAAPQRAPGMSDGREATSLR